MVLVYNPQIAKKPLMVFLPGKLCDQRVWEAQITALNCLVTPLCIDLRPYATLDEMLDRINSLSKQPFILAGFSLGGYVAQEFILKYPEKVSALALVGCSAKGYTEKEQQDYSTLIKLVQDSNVNVMNGSSLSAYLHPLHYNNKQLVAQIENMLNESGIDTYIRQQSATLNRINRFQELKQVQCPALIVGGVEDKIVNLTDVELTAQAIPNSEYHSISPCGHMISMEQPEQLNYILLQWLQKKLPIIKKQSCEI